MGMNIRIYYLRTLFRLVKLIETGLGEMAEWFKAHAWKACLLKGIEGSNPSLSANRCQLDNFGFSLAEANQLETLILG